MPQGTGDGTITTIAVKRADGLEHSTTAETPLLEQPNVRVVVMSVAHILFVRSARAYVTTLLGLMSAGMSGADQGVLPDEFFAMLRTCAGMSVASAVMSLLINGGELLSRLDEKLPKLRA